jgi:hypothetical protein
MQLCIQTKTGGGVRWAARSQAISRLLTYQKYTPLFSEAAYYQLETMSSTHLTLSLSANSSSKATVFLLPNNKPAACLIVRQAGG